jgi:hypothetical protein
MSRITRRSLIGILAAAPLASPAKMDTPPTGYIAGAGGLPAGQPVRLSADSVPGEGVHR